MIPLRTPSQCKFTWDFTQLSGSKRTEWSKNDDDTLKEIIQTIGTDNWVDVARAMASKTDMILTARKCRDRWINHLNPNLKP